MAGKYNPYRPDKLVGPGMFCGRVDEMKFLDHCLLQTRYGNPQHFLIEGERGIGKSSLLLCQDFVATGQILTFDDQKLDFLVVSVSLHQEDNYLSILKKIVNELRATVSARDEVKTLALAAWDLITRVEGFGFKLRDSSKSIDETELLSTLSGDLVSILKTIDKEADGVLILIDEADKPSETANLGLICKLLTEDLTKRQQDRVCIGMAGLPGLIHKLRASHDSSPRIFKTMSLQPLEGHECEEALQFGIADAKKKAGVPVVMNEDAQKLIASLSEGYPHFLQEFAYCAYEEDSDNIITRADVTSSLFRENGAFDQLGRKYFDLYYIAPSSDDYRIVLDTMAEHSDDWITRSALINESGLKAGTVDNAVRSLKTKNIILAHDMKTGQYRLPTKSFAVWIRAKKFARKEAEPNLFPAKVP